MVPGDDGGSRRVGDATRQRIEKLADGWKLPDSDSSAAEPLPPPPSPLDEMPEDENTPMPVMTRAPSATEIDDEDILSVEDSEPELPRTEIAGSGTSRNEDPTVLQPLDATGSGPVVSLRTPAALPRRRGLLGDVRYVFTALLGVARARRELAEVDRKLAKERADRAEELITVAGEAVADPDSELPEVVAAREAIEKLTEQESEHSAKVSARAAEIDALEEEQNRRHALHRDRLAELEEQLAEVIDELDPLEKTATRARKRATDVQVALDDLDTRLAAQESGLDTARDRASAEAALAATRAERSRTAAKQPDIAAELGGLEPRIANLTARRDQIKAEIGAARDEESGASVRTGEKIGAIQAAMAVDERAVADAADARRQKLTALGDQLVIDRPDALAPRLRGVDDYDLFIATLERRALELREIVDGVNKLVVARGVLVLLLVLGAIGAVVWFALYRM